MSSDSIEYVSGGVRVKVDGLRPLMRKLNQSGADLHDRKDLMHDLGMIVVNAATPNAPTKSGALAGTIRAGRGKSKAVVRAGGARAPYAGVQHYGWPARGIPAHPFLTDALKSRHEQIFDALKRGVDELLAKNHLA